MRKVISARLPFDGINIEVFVPKRVSNSTTWTMIYRAAILSLIAAVASASVSVPDGMMMDSPMGKALLRKATVIEHARDLEQNKNNQNQNYISTYEIKYLGCNSLVQLNGMNGQGNNNNKNNNQQSLLYTQQLIRFALCPANSCGSCSGGGQYVVNMADFLDAYTEAKMEEQQYNCEMVRESCYCNGSNDANACEYSCYLAAGLEYCVQYEGQDSFEVQKYMECAGTLMM